VEKTSGAKFTCQAVNTAGMAETSSVLVVQEKPRLEVVDDSQLNQKQRVNNQWKVEVKFTGFPKPQISWSKDGQKIESTKKCSLYVDEESTTIAIYALARDNTGLYQVSATNSAGTTTLDLNLRVIGTYDFHAFQTYFYLENLNFLTFLKQEISYQSPKLGFRFTFREI